MRPATLLVFALSSSVLAAPATDDLDLDRHAASADFEAISGRHIPPPDPVLCAKRKAECQCSKIDKSTSEGFWDARQISSASGVEVFGGRRLREERRAWMIWTSNWLSESGLVMSWGHSATSTVDDSME
ncbi:uncharacterized protein VDAG_06220 [Verticillium dahliae VdLs.17]|uniref:Uncharacterized protein n=1 Tax=Verticillium dahliae (strain VdLs.17 / ATCC MYA-4575 / FGSC 10137) TaxID=498257 RepID=G2X8S9_VERDV|nr:uncharacterized protein VDAG_06220 [Verticillium dahliae VdLs.17]EGY15366.1 hypothetical protein VDAG_06220 [Verticillium dahliae VdLs.17]